MKKVDQIIKILEKNYKDATTELIWSKKYPFQLVVAVILSAQATDKGVNKATPRLFEKYKTPKDFAQAKNRDLEKYTNSINFYRVKTQRIINCANDLLNLYGGEIPKKVSDLIKLKGIGRKSANVILQEIYGIGEGVVVDTHMTRVTKRLGLITIEKKDAEKIEMELNKIIPKNKYKIFSRGIVLLGRYTCKSKKPNCMECPLNKMCPKIGL